MKTDGVSKNQMKREERRRAKATFKIAREILAMDSILDRDAKFAEIEANEHMGLKITVRAVEDCLAELQAKAEVERKAAEETVDRTLAETEKLDGKISAFLQTEPEKLEEMVEEPKTETPVKQPEKKPEKVLWPDPAEEQKKERKVKKIQRKDRKKLKSDAEIDGQSQTPQKKAFIVSLESLMSNIDGEDHVNAVYAQQKGVELSISTHAPFIHRDYGEIIPVIIQRSTIPDRRQPSRKLEKKDVGSWVRKNVDNWEDGIWMMRIGHTNVLSDAPINVNKDVVGLALISSKKVKQKGREVQYFPHIIILNTQDGDIKPAFKLFINDEPGNAEASGEVHIGPTVGAKRDEKEIKEYLHLVPCEQ